MPKHPADYRDFPGDSQERDQAALAVAGTTDPVDAHISDYGEFDGDHSDATHDQANGIASNRDSDGMGYASPSELETYYNSLQPENIRPTGR